MSQCYFVALVRSSSQARSITVTGSIVSAVLHKSALVLGASVLWAGASIGVPAQAQESEASEGPSVVEELIELDLESDGSDIDLEDNRPLARDGSILSMAGAQRLMDEAAAAVSAEDYDLAVEKYKSARQVYNQLSNFYQDLSSSFSGVDTLLFTSHRDRALETAQKRDEATYRLALVHRAQNAPDLAVPLLIQIIRSQQPTRNLGENAYRQLFELGFVDAPYPQPRNVGSAQ